MARKRVVSANGDFAALGREKAAEQGKALWSYASQWEQHDRRGKVLENIRICPPKYFGDKWLIVLKVWEGDRPLVGFHRGQTMLASLLGAFTAMASGRVDWKEDPYAKGATFRRPIE